jgi:hypothetical protein
MINNSNFFLSAGFTFLPPEESSSQVRLNDFLLSGSSCSGRSGSRSKSKPGSGKINLDIWPRQKVPDSSGPVSATLISRDVAMNEM